MTTSGSDGGTVMSSILPDGPAPRRGPPRRHREDSIGSPRRAGLPEHVIRMQRKYDDADLLKMKRIAG